MQFGQAVVAVLACSALLSVPRASAQAQRERIEIERLTGAVVGGRPET